MFGAKHAHRLLAAVALLTFMAGSAPVVVRAAEIPSMAWKRAFASRLDAVAVDGAGNSYVTGSRFDSLSIRKYGPAGAVLWSRSWSAHGASIRGHDVAVGNDGSVYVVGSVSADHFEGSGWFIRKYSADGVFQWRDEVPGWRDGTTATSMDRIAVVGRNVIVAGNDYGCCDDPTHEGWIRTYDTDGALLWENDFEAPSPVGTYDGINDITVDTAGDIYAGGWIAMRVQGPGADLADHEVFLQKLSTGGGVIWTQVLLDSRRRDGDTATALAVQGDQLMVAELLSGAPRGYTVTRPPEATLQRFTLDGDPSWRRQWGERAKRRADPRSVAVNAAGETFVAGTQHDPVTGIEMFLRKYSPTGTLLWVRVKKEGSGLLHGTHVVSAPSGLFATGYTTVKEYGRTLDGYVWKFRG